MVKFSGVVAGVLPYFCGRASTRYNVIQPRPRKMARRAGWQSKARKLENPCERGAKSHKESDSQRDISFGRQEVRWCNSPGSLFEVDWQEALKMGTTCRCICIYIRTTRLYIEHSIETIVYPPLCMWNEILIMQEILFQLFQNSPANGGNQGTSYTEESDKSLDWRITSTCGPWDFSSHDICWST